MDAVEGNIDYSLDAEGREFLGYTPTADMTSAVERRNNGEVIEVAVDAHDDFFIETVLFDDMQETHHSGGRRGLSETDSETIQYSNIYLKEYPDQGKQHTRD